METRSNKQESRIELETDSEDEDSDQDIGDDLHALMD